MSYNRNSPHPPTSGFQVGDRVVVTKVPTCLVTHLANPMKLGATGTVVWISIKGGHPIVAMDEKFYGAMQHMSLPSIRNHPWCCTFPNGEGLELLPASKIEIETLDGLI